MTTRVCATCGNSYAPVGRKGCPHCADARSGSGTAATRPDDRAGFERCEAVYNGNRCEFPGSIRTGGELVCRLHLRCHGHAIADAIVASQEWVSARKAGVDVPLTYTRHDGVIVPGFPGADQERRRVDAWLKERPEKYAGPGPRFGQMTTHAPAVARVPGEDDE